MQVSLILKEYPYVRNMTLVKLLLNYDFLRNYVLKFSNMDYIKNDDQENNKKLYHVNILKNKENFLHIHDWALLNENPIFKTNTVSGPFLTDNYICFYKKVDYDKYITLISTYHSINTLDDFELKKLTMYVRSECPEQLYNGVHNSIDYTDIIKNQSFTILSPINKNNIIKLEKVYGIHEYRWRILEKNESLQIHSEKAPRL